MPASRTSFDSRNSGAGAVRRIGRSAWRDDVGEHARDVAARHHDLVVLAAEVRDHLALEAGLVVLGVLEAQRERRELRALGAQAERGDERAVEAAGQVAADRHVGAQHAQAGGVLERVAHRVDGVVERAAEAAVPRLPG